MLKTAGEIAQKTPRTKKAPAEGAFQMAGRSSGRGKIVKCEK